MRGRVGSLCQHRSVGRGKWGMGAVDGSVLPGAAGVVAAVGVGAPVGAAITVEIAAVPVPVPVPLLVREQQLQGQAVRLVLLSQ